MPIRKWTMLSALSLGLLAAGSGGADAGLIGSVVHGRYLFPDSGTVLTDAGTQTIANGTVFNFNAITAQFSDTQITVTNPFGGLRPAAFNGIDLAFLSGAAIASVTEDPASSPRFAPGSVLAFTSDDIRLNLSMTCGTCRGGDQIILDVATASAVPEPSAMALLGVGLLGLGITARRKAA